MKFCNFPGNEKLVEEIAEKLNEVIVSQSLQNNPQELRKITFFLMINTQLRDPKNEINECEKICHLLNNFTQLSKCLFVNLIWKLKLQDYLCDAIKFAPTWFTLSFLSELVDSFRFLEPLQVTNEVRSVVTAIYLSICRMDFKVLSSERREEQATNLAKLIDEYVKALLRNYNTPVSDESITKSKRKLQSHLGNSFRQQLLLTHTCFQLFLSKPKLAVEKEHEIFKISNSDREVDNHSKTYAPNIEESLKRFNSALLNSLQSSLLNITLDDFMYWVEIDIEDPEIEDVDLKRDNLQKSIGEYSYLLIKLIEEHECFTHDISKQLATISIKPKTLEEIAASATVGTILEKIETSVNRRVWLEELLNRKETLYFNEECLATIKENYELLSFANLMKMLEDHQHHEMDAEDEMQIKEIFRLGSKNFRHEHKRDFCEELVRALGADYNLVADTSTDLTNYFNKLTESSINEDEMWNLILLNPSMFFAHMLKDIQKQDETQIEITLQILQTTHSIAEDFLKEIILESLNHSGNSHKSIQHVFFAGVFRLELVDRKTFVREIVMENLIKAMTNDDLHLLLLMLKTLNQIAKSLKVEEFVAPLQIVLAQILDKMRWDLITFSQIRETIVELSIENIQTLTKIVIINGAQRDRDWIISKTENLKLLTKFYFQKLKMERGEQVVHFDQFLQPDGFENIPQDKITSFLCENIVRCTTKELKWLMGNERLQKSLTDALLVVAVIVGKSTETKPLNCLHKCVADYVKMMREVIPPPADKSHFLSNIVNIIKKFPVHSLNELSIIFLDLLQTLKGCENFSSQMSEIEDCELKRILLDGDTA